MKTALHIAPVSNNRSLSARIYVENSLLQSQGNAAEVSALLSSLNVPHRIVEVLAEPNMWEVSGFQTVPAIELLVNEKPVRSWAGTLSLDVLRTAIAELHSDEVLPLPDRLIHSYRVTKSTGAHRYSRWNEQALCADAELIGWGGASHTDASPEEIEIDLYGIYSLTAVGMQPRDWSTCIDYKRSFPKTFRVVVSADRKTWTEALAVSDYHLESTTMQIWHFTARAARYVKLLVLETDKRPEGKFFCQIMKLRFWRDGTLSEPQLQPSFESLELSTSPNNGQPFKRGIMWSESSGAESWDFQPGQRLPFRILENKVITWVVVGGELTFIWRDSKGSESRQTVGTYSVVTVPCRVPCAIEATNGAAKALSITQGQGNEVWVNR